MENIDGTDNIIEAQDDLDIDLGDEPKEVEQPSSSLDKAQVEALIAGIVKRHLKDVSQKQVPKLDEDLVRDVNELKVEKAKRQFAYQHGLSPEETDMIFQLNPNPSKDDLENPFIKGGIDALRSKKRLEDATPTPSSSATVLIEGKEFKDLPEEDRAKNWEDYVKKSINK